MVDALKIMAVAALISCAILVGTNIAIQWYVCGQQWRCIDPFQIQRCEPVGLLRSEMEKYRRLADDTR